MRAVIVEHIRSRVRWWGARLNALQAVLVGAIVANSGSIEKAIAAIIPAKYAGAAGLIAGVASYIIVDLARSSDTKKAAGNA